MEDDLPELIEKGRRRSMDPEPVHRHLDHSMLALLDRQQARCLSVLQLDERQQVHALDLRFP
jgi:hypothetical protein